MTEPYIVTHCNAIPTNQLVAWVKVYCCNYNDHTDMHQLFADEIHLSRSEAKKVAHMIAWKLSKGMENLGHYIGRVD